MNDVEKKHWFPAKKYGWGWGLPCTWQGWAALLGYIGLLVAGAVLPDAVLLDSEFTDSPWFVIFYILYTLVLTAAFLFLCWKKGEKTRFRWGD